MRERYLMYFVINAILSLPIFFAINLRITLKTFLITCTQRKEIFFKFQISGSNVILQKKFP